MPIRCWTCGFPTGYKVDLYEANIQRGMTPQQACAAAKVKRTCCARMLMAATDEETVLQQYDPYRGKFVRDSQS